MSPRGRPVRVEIAGDWRAALEPVADQVSRVEEFLRAERAAGRTVLPVEPLIWRALERPLADVRVLIVGQDPYPTPGHPTGLAFSADRSVRPLPRSLSNLYRELTDDLGCPAPEHGDLSAWADQGVLLLNRVLTVRAGNPGSHRGRGWEDITGHLVQTLAHRGGPLVAVLWGRQAAAVIPALGQVPRIESAHPSPLSASRGFFGSRPFSRANDLLRAQGARPIDWSLPR